MNESPLDDADHIGRRTPAKGVILSPDMPLTFFCTVCTQDRATWAAQADVMDALHKIWQYEATAWLVGNYILMPDHMHYICSPRDPKDGVEIEKWTAFWKDCFAKTTQRPEWRWQRGVFHSRMRSDAHYQEKLDYMRENPVRKSLAMKSDDWPWQGQVHDFSAHIRAIGGRETRD